MGGAKIYTYVFVMTHFAGVVVYKGVMKTHLKKGKGKVQGVPQSQTAALSRHQEKEETDKTKQAQIEQTYEKHLE